MFIRKLAWQLLLAVAGLALVSALLWAEARPARSDSAESPPAAVVTRAAAAGDLCLVRQPASGGMLVEGIVGAPRTLNPLFSDSNPVDQLLTDLIFDGLVRRDADDRLVPALATGWEISADGLTVRFTLRDDVRWHDGTPFSARDVVFTYGLLQGGDSADAIPLAALWRSVTIVAVDDRTVDFTLAAPYAGFVEATTRGILPAHLLADVPAVALRAHPFSVTPVGTGPFRLAPGSDWQRTGYVRLQPNPDQWETTGIDLVELRFYADDAALLAAFDAGEIQTMTGLTPESIAAAGLLTDARLHTVPAARYTQLLFNQDAAAGHSSLRDKQVRQGLAFALDRHAIIDSALHGQGLLLDGPYLPSSWVYEPGITLYAHNVLSATAQLDAAGWVAPPGGQLREKGDEFLRLRLLTVADPLHTAVARRVQSQWQQVGVAVDVTTLAPDAFRAALQARDFDAALLDVAPLSDPDLYDFWSQEAIIDGQNFGAWNNQRASEALETARQQWEPAEREPYYHGFLRYYNADVPAITLYQMVTTYVMSEGVDSAEIPPHHRPRDRYANFADWTVLFRDVQIPCSPN